MHKVIRRGSVASGKTLVTFSAFFASFLTSFCRVLNCSIASRYLEISSALAYAYIFEGRAKDNLHEHA